MPGEEDNLRMIFYKSQAMNENVFCVVKWNVQKIFLYIL